MSAGCEPCDPALTAGHVPAGRTRWAVAYGHQTAPQLSSARIARAHCGRLRRKASDRRFTWDGGVFPLRLRIVACRSAVPSHDQFALSTIGGGTAA